MKSTNTFTTVNNMIFEANENLTYCWAYPQGLKGQRKRISKKEYLQAKKEDEIIRANLERMAIEAEAEKAVEEQDAQQELEDELLKAAEDPTVSVEEFVDMITTPKAKKTTKKSTKKAAYQSRIVVADDKVADVTLTEKQVNFLHEMSNSAAWEGIDSPVWIDILCDQIGGQFTGKPMTVGAMISTLCEKDLGLRTTCRRENRKCVSFELTELGQLVAKELGLN